jgi:hypothetical protein
MNWLGEIRDSGGVTVEMEGVKKEPDGSWGPRHSNITCVLEAALSESDRAMHRDARIWLEHPESKVTQVITAEIHRARADIIFSVWKLEYGRATVTRLGQATHREYLARVLLSKARHPSSSSSRVS